MADEKANMGRTATVAFLDLLRGALWPAVVAASLLYFAGPLRDILSGFSQNLRSAQSIDLGYVKIAVRENKTAPPEPDVGRALAKLDRVLLGVLIDHSTDSGYWICAAPNDSYNTERKRRYDKLVELNLVRYEPKADSTSTQCEGSVNVAWLSDLGKATKAYFQRVVLEQITFVDNK